MENDEDVEMIKFKHFEFVIVIIVAVLLVMGNWVIPAQANSGSITPQMSTSTPIPESKSESKPVPIELQKDLEAVVQAYFEMRYEALSISHPYGFRPSGFGDLVSDVPEGKKFLDAELGKLALAIKYAEINQSRYVGYKYFLDFGQFARDPVTQLVTAVVVENNEIITENSAEGNPTHPLVAQMKGLKHTIVVRKEQEHWKIVSDDYNDFLWRTLRKNGKSAEEMLEMLNTVEVPPTATTRNESSGTETAPLLPDDPSSHTYDRNSAVQYAVNHAWPQDYNPNYPSYDDGAHGDCTNFVSQSLYEGGNISMEIPSPLPPPSNIGQGEEGWYLLNDMQRGRYWNDVDAFYNFVTQSYLFWHEGPEGYELGPVAEGQFPAGLMVGDVIQYNAEDDAYWEHSAIVVGFDQNNGDPLVASHSPNNPQINFKDVVQHVKTRFIHIERSDGNPPIKAEITARADDWGPNLYDNCTPPTLTTNNEIYFGACPSNGSPITSGFRFNNIQIPRGADLKYAYITFTVDGPYGINPPSPVAPISVHIYEENNVNSTVTWDINGSVSVLYDTWNWRNKRTTPDLQTILEPIIGLEGWNIGQSLSIMFTNNGSVHVRRVMAIDRVFGTIYPPDPSLTGYWTARLIAAYSLVDVTAPAINTINRVSASPTNATDITFSAVFSEPVIGVDISDFTLATSGVSGASITNVSGSGDTYNVTVNTGSGEGTIRLDVSNNNTITDLASNPLNGGYTGGETYAVDKTSPTVLSSTRASTNPTKITPVDFTVTFSEPVTGVDANDFSLTTTGTLSGAAVASVWPVSANAFTVRVNTGTGTGTIRLNVLSNGSIVDLALNPFTGGFFTGQAYTVMGTFTAQSVGTYDGWVLESTETSGVGGAMNSAATTFNLGDDASDRQYVGILHFDTSSLPDTAVIKSATLKIKKYSLTGTDPFTILGDLLVDMRKPSFGTVDLAIGDFQAATGRIAVAAFDPAPVNNWFSALLNASGRNYINLTGTTQFRLRFTMDDNDNNVADYLRFYSGDHGTASVWPMLVIEYYVP